MRGEAMTTSTRPIPVPPQGTALHWHLSAPYNAKHLLVLIAVMGVSSFSVQ